MPITVTITCVHCGKAFATTMPTDGTGIGSYGAQHSAPTCGKITRVYYKYGQVQKTDTK
jgi:hypothetical protein